MKLYKFVIKKVLLDKCNYHSRNRITIQRSPFLAVMTEPLPLQGSHYTEQLKLFLMFHLQNIFSCQDCPLINVTVPHGIQQSMAKNSCWFPGKAQHLDAP